MKNLKDLLCRLEEANAIQGFHSFIQFSASIAKFSENHIFYEAATERRIFPTKVLRIYFLNYDSYYNSGILEEKNSALHCGMLYGIFWLIVDSVDRRT